MKRRLETLWYRAAPPPRWLRPLSRIYAWVSARRAVQRRATAQRLPVPVIVVGNIAVGGTGKTPVVLWLIDELLRQGRHPGVLSRGYGGRGPFPREVMADSDPSASGDEPVLIALRARVPVAVAPDRVAAGRFLLANHPQIDVLVCDDGLQHYGLARDFEICVIDGARGFGNGWLLPAGPLREPPVRAAQAQLILVNGADAAGFGAQAERFDLNICEAVNLANGEVRALRGFAGTQVEAIAGIGHPQRFFDSLRAAGLSIRGHEFADHHVFRAAELRFADEAPLLMTEKDAVKCRSFARPNWWQVPAQLGLAPEAEARVRARIVEAVRTASAAPRGR